MQIVSLSSCALDHATCRLFIALDLPLSIIIELTCIQTLLKKEQGIRATFPHSFHLTIQFLGQIKKEDIPIIHQKLAEFPPILITISLEKLLVFHTKHKLDIVSVEISSETLPILVDYIKQALSQNIKEEKSFLPHITLARIKKIEHKEQFLSLISKITINPIKVPIKTFSLEESYTFQTGAQYATRARYKLL